MAAHKREGEDVSELKPVARITQSMRLEWLVSHDDAIRLLGVTLYAVLNPEEPAHDDHPLRHWSRTCPACNASIDYSDHAPEGNS
jgi:hypothetical protein